MRDRLIEHARACGVDIRFGASMTGLASAGEAWDVRLDDGVILRASNVVVATGGLSVPNTGSDGTGLRLLEALGHTLHPTYPALPPLTTG
ncbi:MAG: NAD(P)/FAD-dependent oxidoreductase, partial [Gemmatimonadota bacterium]|nr:NAD(P)/FAD-dependent oxidoreductase [Gemmatimonadota bacterium]